MKRQYAFYLTCLLFVAGQPIALTAQENGAAEQDVDKAEAKDAGAEESDLAEATEAETSKASGESTSAEETTGAAEKETAGKSSEPSAPKDLNLDMKALGEVNPQKDLARGGAVDESTAKAAAAEEWTERELDILELHGYFRVRPEFYHNFNIRGDEAVYNRPMEQIKTAETDSLGDVGEDCRDKGDRKGCRNSTLAGANLRLRVEPTLNVSEEVWVKAKIDFLDNVMMGSTPRFWQNYGLSSTETVEHGRIQGYNMGPPDSSQMIVVRRAWGEVTTPLGQLRFGRMADHWGLGMLHNAGNGIDEDFGDSVDRIMFAAKINDWLIAPAFDFPNEGMSSEDASGRPFDVSQLDDTYQLTGIFAYKHDSEEQLAMIKRGDWLVNTGLYFTYRSQVLSFEKQSTEEEDPSCSDTASVSEDICTTHYYRRDMWAITPDFWFQFLFDTFRLELEIALIYGEVGNPERDIADFNDTGVRALTLAEWGGTLQADYGLLSDQLRIGVEISFAMGDKDVEGLRAPGTFDQRNKTEDSKYTAFSFNPAYNTDFILYRHILGSVSQTYYFNAWLRYDFLKNALGRKMGIQFDVVYSRAVFEQSTINNHTGNVGVELDGQAMYLSQDNFYAGIKYGVLFPLRAFQGTPLWDSTSDSPYVEDTDLSIPQTVQAILGIMF